MESKRFYLCVMALVFVCVLSVACYAANDRPLIYGINPIPGEWAGHPNNPTWETMQYDKMKAAGCTAVRAGIGWDLIEPTPGARNWGDIDDSINSYLDRGFEPVLLIVATPSWALLPGQGVSFYAPQPQFRPDFERFVYDVARKFRGRVKYYEFWNEENGAGWHTDQGCQKAEEYAPWLIHGYNAIKKGDPNALWSIGGLDDIGTGCGHDYLRKCYNYMAKGYFDAVCEHPYSSTTVGLSKLDRLRSVMADYNDAVPIWITELGWASKGKEGAVAGWITDYFTRLSSDQYNYCKIATYHTAVDFTAQDAGYGLMQYDDTLSTKVTYTAFLSVAKPGRVSVSTAPIATSLSPAKMRVAFNSSAAATSQIMYGTTNAYGMVTARETAASSSHLFEIDGLQPNRTYHYRIRVGAGEYADNFSSDCNFTTPNGYAVGVTGNVEVTRVTHNGATISWTTNVPASTKVEYGSGYDYPLSVSDSTLSTQHSVTLTGLQPNTAYQARIVSSKTSYGNLSREIDTIVTRRQPGVLENGGFEDCSSRQPWVVYGKSDGRVAGQSYMGIASRSGGAFFCSAASYDCKTGGCYQQVGATPGRMYLVRAYTRSFQQGGTPGENAARLGIDTAGGFDQNSPSIVWGQYKWDQSQYVPIECSARAAGDQITVYIDIKQPYSLPWNINVVDDVELYQLDSPR